MNDQRPTTNDQRPTTKDGTPSSLIVGHWSASAPAKLILCGEHAVVYGRPAIALPLSGIRARAEISDNPLNNGIVINAPDLERRWSINDHPDDPLSALVANTLDHLSRFPPPASHLAITITSDIPIASGMGSGAAVATAIVRALAAYANVSLKPSDVSALVYESERRLHGTPSGIDNTVIAWEQPVWFQRTTSDRGLTINNDRERLPVPAARFPSPTSPIIAPITIAQPFTLLIGDTGKRSATHFPVGDVRQRWEAAPQRYEVLFDKVGAVVTRIRAELANGDLAKLGALLDENHALTQAIGVSSPELDTLVNAARSAGALGAKLSGAGWGGVMLALVTPEAQGRVEVALRAAGATQVLATIVAATDVGESGVVQ